MIFFLKQKIWIGFFALAIFFCVIFWHLPLSFIKTNNQNFIVEKGWGSKEIAKNLDKQKLISNALVFRLYVLLFGQHGKLQAGVYELSPSMSIVQIAQKIASGEIVKNKITVLEGWDTKDIGEFLEQKGFMKKNDFLLATQTPLVHFTFLDDKPKNLSLEGYLFPDTYEISATETASSLINKMLAHFDEKLTPEIRQEIKRQKKSIFKIVVMASILEKEVRTLEDKKIVAGILWKRIAEGMPLQVDATINYITRKDHAGVLIADTQIDSPYNTYKYYGLPLGPISNPGIESILAAIYPTKSDYWYYLSDQKTGKSIFSKTLEEHNIAVYKYLR